MTVWAPDTSAGETIGAVTLGASVAVPEPLPAGECYRTPSGHQVWFLVSLLTASALRGREDIVTTGPEIRDETGRILGCRGLRRVV